MPKAPHLLTTEAVDSQLKSSSLDKDYLNLPRPTLFCRAPLNLILGFRKEPTNKNKP